MASQTGAALVVLQRTLDLQMQVKSAAELAYRARLEGTAEALDKQAALCNVLRTFVAEVIAGKASTDGLSLNAVVNEFAVLGDFLTTAGRFSEADAAFEEAKCASGRLGTPDHQKQATIAQIGLARSLQQRGAYAQALRLLYTARDALPPDGADPDAQVSAAVNLGEALCELFRWLGDHRRAIRELAVTKRLARQLARAAAARGHSLFEWDLAQLLFQDALLLLDRGRWRWAGRAFAATEGYIVSLGPASAATLHYYRARLALGEGNFGLALALTDKARPAFEELPPLQHKRGTLRVLRAQILIDAGRGGEALSEAVEGVQLETAAEQHETIWKAHWQEARTRRAIGGSGEALPAFDRAVAVLDQARNTSLGLRLDNLFLKERLPVVEEAILCAAEHGDAGRCLTYADTVKSRFLARALHAGKPPKPRPEWAERLGCIGLELEAAPIEKRPSLVLERAAILERLRLERGPLPLPPSDPEMLLSGLAAQDQAALQLWYARGRVVTVLLQDGCLELETLELTPQAREALRAYATNLMLARPSGADFDPQHLGLDATDLVPPRLLERALGAQALLVSPHAALNILPWASLPRGGRRLFEFLPVGQLPCLAALPSLAVRPTASPRLMLFGDPQTQRATAQEAKADLGSHVADLAVLYGPDRMVAPPVTRQAAKVEGLQDLLAKPGAQNGILHLACHGRFDHDDPEGSGLLLADRMLTAAELSLRPLPAGEVTLAACSTGVRPEAAGGVRLLGDDVVGLPAALLEAGAASILVSVTLAGAKEAGSFFCAYHTARLDGQAPLRAFATAQRRMLAEPWKIHRWAGFTLYGCT